MGGLLVFLVFLAIRAASVLLVQTFFVPDEYWQSLEVAHRLVFGYGYLSWEWVQGIRSYVYPAVFAGVYKGLAYFNLDSVEALVLLPRVLQATLSAYSDYRLFVWAGKTKWAVFLLALPYFWFYTASRTLVNTLETALTAIALSFFPWKGEGTAFLWIAALCSYIRPTSAVIWPVLCFYHLKKTKLSVMGLLLKRYLLIGTIVVGLCIAVDSYFYGKITISPWEFLKFNVLENVGTHYGTHPWYWYCSIGLPLLVGVNLFPFIVGTYETVRSREVFPVRLVLLVTMAVYLVVLSCLPHKEFRLILILMPMVSYICSDSISRWSRKASSLKLWLVAALILCGNIVPGWYLSTVHQRGTLAVMEKLAKTAKDYRGSNGERAFFLFVMPCHSTPYYSHIHENITMQFLHCEPNLRKTPNYIDEADLFYQDPTEWMHRYYSVWTKTGKVPSHVITFNNLEEELSYYLKPYERVLELKHTEYPSERVGRSVVVFEVRPPPSKSAQTAKSEYPSLDNFVEGSTNDPQVVPEYSYQGDDYDF